MSREPWAAEELDGAIADIRSAGRDSPPGIAIAVRSPAGTFAAVDGERILPEDAHHPLTFDSHHDLASITKIVATTASIMRLVDEGELEIDRTVKEMLPDAGVAAGTTVRDLLLHRAGLWEWWPLYIGTSGRDEATAMLDGLPLRYPPGNGRHYSDLGFMLLGRIVEVIAGAALPAAAADLVFDPLGMAATSFIRPNGDRVAASSRGDAVERGMLATGEPYPVPFHSDDFDRWRTGLIVGEVNDGNAFHAFGGVSGHAGLFSTLGDLLTFASALAAPEDGEFVSRSVRETFFSPGPDPEQALGFRLSSVRVAGEERTVVGHPGFTGSYIGIIPELGVSVVLATNRLLSVGDPLSTEGMFVKALAGVARLIEAELPGGASRRFRAL